MSARASSFGDPDLYVCMTPSRAYDIDENRVLVAALVAVRDAAALRHREHADAPPGGRHAAHGEAQRQRRRPLRRAPVAAGRVAGAAQGPGAQAHPLGQEEAHLRAGARRCCGREANPLSADDVRAWCDKRTLLQHRVLMGVIHRLELRGARLPPFRTERGALYSGPVQYYHGRLLGDREALAGIVIGSLLIDVPDRAGDPSRSRAEIALKARAHGRPSMVIMDESDLDVAVSKAIELVRSKST